MFILHILNFLDEMNTKGLFLFLVLITTSAFAQKYETAQGDVANISGIKLYKIDFEYAEVLKIPKYSSEKAFIDQHIKELKTKGKELTENFEQQWFEKRETIFEPTFIQEFNAFRLDNRHITVSKNYTESRYNMLVNITLIYPGHEALIWDKAAELEVTITFTDHESPNVVLFATKIVKIHGTTRGDVFDKITTAYGQLGRWTAKFLCRKT